MDSRGHLIPVPSNTATTNVGMEQDENGMNEDEITMDLE